MAEILKNVESLALNPAYHDLFTVFKGARNGMVYGAKIRFPHALVMTFMFGRGTPLQKMQYVIKATRQHSLNLTKFVGLYKLLTILMRNTNSAKKELPHESFLAGCVAGYVVFGDRNPVNEQIVLYCIARCVASLLPREPVSADYPASKVIPIEKKTFSIFAALVWGCVMWLFKNRRQRLQGSLVSSMDYLYVNAEKWKDLRTLFWHNT
ncbi:peroxisomal membrane protein 4 [Meira miltonrushii]|uniref:Peroxisomal membrane protein 4 n=1 Tax=Meira miltonrushii TaxID=1280837 RepID=A0A316V2Y1_9BASI|nr:peroxisomal membrane protein 4 [Meira miltonrushii]PWN31917.1 peroxisomal membrane protein 4 [Meira miltonrushii]